MVGRKVKKSTSHKNPNTKSAKLKQPGQKRAFSNDESESSVHSAYPAQSTSKSSSREKRAPEKVKRRPEKSERYTIELDTVCPFLTILRVYGLHAQDH